MPTVHMTCDRSAQSDEQLMAAYLNDDPGAFRELFHRYSGALMRYFQRYGLSAHDAQDLVQQTFLRLHRARDGYRVGTTLRSWIYVIARNTGYDHARRRRRRPEVFCDPDQQLAAELGTDTLAQEERVRALSSALETLPAAQRALLVTHWCEERSWSEIAAIDGTPAGTLRVRAHRACLQLRSLMDADSCAPCS